MAGTFSTAAAALWLNLFFFKDGGERDYPHTGYSVSTAVVSTYPLH